MINREFFRWIVMLLFIGMAAVSVFVVIYSLTNLAGGPGFLILRGALVYLLVCFAVTAFFNVPMNETLASMGLTSETTRDYWSATYLPRWTTWNTVRAIACAHSTALMLFGLIWLKQVKVRLARLWIGCLAKVARTFRVTAISLWQIHTCC